MTNQSKASVFSPAIDEKILQYLKYMLDYNEKVNLTAIREFQEAINKHLVDSLSATLWDGWTEVKKVIDLGSGAGLPGIPLAINYPEKMFTLIEANGKKADFLRLVVKEFALENVTILQQRAEETGRMNEYRGQSDLVLSRAVGSLPILLELGMPLLKCYGHLIAYKGPQINGEIDLAKKAQMELSAADPTVISYLLPDNSGERHLAIYQKMQETSIKYPRRIGIPEKKPIR